MQLSFRTLLYFEALLFIVLGLIAVTLPQLVTTGLELLIGAVLIAAGIVQLIRLLQSHAEVGFWAVLFSGLLNLCLGGLLLFFPLAGVLSLTYLLIVYFIFDGASKISYAFQLKPRERWGWMLLSGILSLMLSVLIFIGLPGIATWVLGLLVGINLFFFGVSLLGLASAIPEK